MNRILSAANVDVLAQYAWSRVLLAFDFDGTLAPIVPDRDDARMRPRTRALLEEICRRYPCAVISGRSRDGGGVTSKVSVLRSKTMAPRCGTSQARPCASAMGVAIDSSDRPSNVRMEGVIRSRS